MRSDGGVVVMPLSEFLHKFGKLGCPGLRRSGKSASDYENMNPKIVVEKSRELVRKLDIQISHFGLISMILMI